jgi:hypothetical protein
MLKHRNFDGALDSSSHFSRVRKVFWFSLLVFAILPSRATLNNDSDYTKQGTYVMQPSEPTGRKCQTRSKPVIESKRCAQEPNRLSSKGKHQYNNSQHKYNKNKTVFTKK